MSTDLLSQLADYGADHEDRQSGVTADEVLGVVVPIPVHATRPFPPRRVVVVLAAAAVATLVVALPLLLARPDAPPSEPSTPSTPTTTIADASPTTTVQPTTTTAPDEAPIRAMIDSYAEASSAGDAETASAAQEILEATIHSTFASYIDAVNAGDTEAALAATEFFQGDADPDKATERLKNQAEFMIELGWDYTLDRCLTLAPEEGEVICALAVSSPLHEALDIEVSDLTTVSNLDAIWTFPHPASEVIVVLHRRVVSALGTWMATNDPEARFDSICAPDANGNHDGLPDLNSVRDPRMYENFAYWDAFIYTGECGAYLNSITPDVVASIEAAEG